METSKSTVNRVFVAAVMQHMEWATDTEELKGIGERLKRDKLATSAEKRLLRSHYLACMKALSIEVNVGVTDEQVVGILPEDLTGQATVEGGATG